MRPLRKFLASRRKQRGEAIVEGMMSMLLISLIFFGLLQVFYISVAQIFVDYSAFATANAASLGMTNGSIGRFAQTAVVGASGSMVIPAASSSFESGSAEAEAETLATYSTCRREKNVNMGGLCVRYNAGITQIDYQYWKYHDTNKGWMKGETAIDTNFWSFLTSRSDEVIESLCEFSNYPFNFPMWASFTTENKLKISSTAKAINYMTDYMDFGD